MIAPFKNTLLFPDASIPLAPSICGSLWMILLYTMRLFRQCQKPPNLGRLCTAFWFNLHLYAILREYIRILCNAGVYSHAVCRGPCRAFWAGRPKRRRAPPGSVPGSAQGQFRFRGRCRRRRDGEGKAPSLRELAKPSGFDGRSFFRTQKGSGSRFWEPLLAVISGVFVAQGLSTGASKPEPRWTGCKR